MKTMFRLALGVFVLLFASATFRSEALADHGGPTPGTIVGVGWVCKTVEDVLEVLEGTTLPEFHEKLAAKHEAKDCIVFGRTVPARYLSLMTKVPAKDDRPPLVIVEVQAANGDRAFATMYAPDKPPERQAS